MKYYKKGFKKHIPEFLLSSIRPKIIDDIIQRGDIIGKIAGINIKPIDFENNKDLEEYIIAIKKIKPEKYTSLYIEGSEYIPRDAMDYIEKSLNMKVPNGKDIRINYIPVVMKEIYKLLKYNLQEKEALVLCGDKNVTKEITKIISKDIKFITTLGCSQGDNQEIYEYILEETGLSLFQSSNINKVLENYSIIINLIDDYDFNISKIKRNCIIFDYGNKSSLSNNKSKSNILNRIEDIAFDIRDLEIDSNEWVSSRVKSDLYEVLNKDNRQKIPYIYSEGGYYTIKDYVSSFIKLKGNL